MERLRASREWQERVIRRIVERGGEEREGEGGGGGGGGGKGYSRYYITMILF